jgi:hypothetical protein
VRKEAIAGITLDDSSTLFDLLRTRILDTSPEWKTRIDTLINIPPGEKGEKLLRGGDYFEALFQLAIAIGVLPFFQGKRIKFHDIVKYKDTREFENYLRTKTVKNSGGDEQGISDITFEIDLGDDPTSRLKPLACGEVPPEESKEESSTSVASTTTPNNPLYFISVKGFKREKSIAKEYDIPILGEQVKALGISNKTHIIVCVRNKDQFMKRLARSRMEFLKNSIDQVIGYDEVMNAFSTFRTNFFLKLDAVTDDTVASELERMFPPAQIYKPSLSLYFHQELVVKSVLNRISENPEPQKPYFLCVGVLPRGGKSYIAGGIVDAHRKMKAKDTYNVLFLTSAVNETREQFKEDLVEKFSEFKDFTFIDVVNPDKKKKSSKFNFVFVSRQLSSLDKEEEGKETSALDLVSRVRKVLKTDITFDLCFFDEAHIGIVSEKVRDQFRKTFEQFKMPIVLMSATYKKPALVLDDPRDLLVWDLQDIKDMKSLPSLKLSGFLEKNPDVLQRYPDIAKQILEKRVSLGQTEDIIAKPYMQFPMPNFISLTFTPDTIQHLKDTGMGYDYMKAFQINTDPTLLNDRNRYTEWGTLLANREDALRIREFLTPEQENSTEFLSDKLRKYRAFNQIFSIAQKTGSRPFIGKPFSMIMFLPFGPGLPIGELCRIWGSFLLENPYWRKNFVVMTLSSYAQHTPDPSITVDVAVKRGLCHREDFKGSLKETIQEVEQTALKYGKGLVLLSGDVAKMGISLKCVDVVCLMSNNKDADDIIQKMYRALTDDPPSKKNGFIIDLNLKRIVTAMFEYDMEKSRRTLSGTTTTPAERINQLMELCNWGQDAYMIDNPDKSFDDMMNDIRMKVFATIESHIRSEYGSRDLVDKQFKIIENNPELLKNVVNILQFTTGKRAKKTKDNVYETGADISASTAAVGSETTEEETTAKPKSVVQPLSIEQIKKKIVDIMITFINALVIKSNTPWQGMDFKTLIDKYYEDKKTATRVCSCYDVQECGTSFSNLYDIAFCELQGYAMLETKPDEVVYNSETHELIMSLMDEIFAKSNELSPDWTNYIHSLIEDITKKKLTPQGGVYKHKTERNKPKKINNNVRNTTKRNYSRGH